jgi:acetyl esterase
MEINPILKEIVDPRLIDGLELDMQIPLPVTESSTIEDLHAVMTKIETQNDEIGVQLLENKPRAKGLSKEIVVIEGADGNEIPMHICRPQTLAGKGHCILYLHGGGMGVYGVDSSLYTHVADDFAATLGVTVIAVEFRNSSGRLGPHPFPAGLHDCKSALLWAHAQKEARSFNKIVIVGESGGANLSIALSLLLKSENKHHYIDGLYLMCPFISGLYSPTETEESKRLPSLWAFNRCGVIDLSVCNAFARLYDPEGHNARNPLTWPYFATVEDLRDFPRCAMSLNEADLLYDEGLHFFRRLLKAKVDARCRTVQATPHAGDLLSMQAVPCLYLATLYDVKAFVDAL